MIRQPELDEWGRVKQSGNARVEDPGERLRNKLRAMLELSRSADEKEAGMAAAKLQQFLTEHNLSIADLESRGQSRPGVREQPHDLGKAGFKWKLDLADGIAEFYYCHSMVDRRAKTVAFVGRPENVEALQMLYGWVIDQIKAIATTERRAHYDSTGEHIDPLRWQIGFGEGAVERLIVRLREMKTRQQEDMSRDDFGNVTALAVHHASEVSDYLEEKFGYRTDGRKTKRELAWDERYRAIEAERRREREEKDNLRIRCEESGDMEPYYAKYPEARPEIVKASEEARRKELERWRKQEERNARRRTGSYRAGPKVDWDKLDQTDSARSSGRAAAGKVNLQPFVTGTTERTKVGNG